MAQTLPPPEKNMTTFAALALIAALAPSSSALDWNAGDPAAQALLQFRRPAADAAARPGGGGGGVAGQFDSYVFSLEWTAAFCEGKSGLPECAALTADRFDAKNLALHGLWPDKNADASHTYGYCGVDAQTQSLDKAATWCRMPDIGLSGATLSRLTSAMPGTASCLQNHEWYKHGSCSGFSPDDYFARAAGLVERIAGTNFGRFLTTHVGQTVAASDLLSAFEADFGPGSRNDVSLSCTNAHGASLLLDVRLHLSNPLRPAEELAGMLLPSAGSGNCPAQFLIDPAPAR
jgi:ribonuclease T2